jgi:hypothetical protein
MECRMRGPGGCGKTSFFNERVDLYVDGSSLARPQTPWA